MRIVCSATMPLAREAFESLGDVVVLDERGISSRDVKEATILAIRSTIKVNRELLEGSSVRFVGTATIGTDHMDLPYLEQAGIPWCYAPGCNAHSVSEYVTSALLCLAVRRGFDPEGKTIGVVGVGNVGSLVAEKAAALGMNVLRNDPPRERLEYGKRSEAGSRRPDSPSPFVSLEEVLERSDVVTLHVPLTKEGADATFHMADRSFFERMKPGCVFFNCARGAVLRTDELRSAMDHGTVSSAVIDTWEGEPAYRKDLLERVDIGTPHIAGHSFEGKVMGTVMVYRAACRFLGVAPAWSPDGLWPPPTVPEIRWEADGRGEAAGLWRIVRQVYDIEEDDRRLRAGNVADEKQRAQHFDRLRKDYPVRREFRFTRVCLSGASVRLAKTVAALGFDVA